MSHTSQATHSTPRAEPLGARISHSYWATLLLISALCTVSACDIFGRQGFSDLGTIVSLGDTAAISLPDSAAVGESFSVTIETFGSGCTLEVDRTEHEIQGLAAQITPWDWNSGALDCPTEMQSLHHEVKLSFDQPGTATVYIIGREETAQGSTEIRIGRQILIH